MPPQTVEVKTESPKFRLFDPDKPIYKPAPKYLTKSGPGAVKRRRTLRHKSLKSAYEAIKVEVRELKNKFIRMEKRIELLRTENFNLKNNQKTLGGKIPG